MRISAIRRQKTAKEMPDFLEGKLSSTSSSSLSFSQNAHLA
jgi:hypothetical protein